MKTEKGHRIINYFGVQYKILHKSFSPYSSCFHACRRTDSYLNSLYRRMCRRLTRHSGVIRTYQSGSEPGINCSKRYSDINLVVVTRHSGGVHCSLMCCMTPGGPCDLQPHVEGGPVSHTTGDVTWRSSAPWRIRQWGKTARRSCKPYVLSLLRQVWLLGYYCAHHENNLFGRNKWSLSRFVSFMRQYANDSFLTLCSPVVIICTTSVTFNNSSFSPRSVFMCFVWIWEQTAIISLYSINWLVFITETWCVYCAVRTGSFYIYIYIYIYIVEVNLKSWMAEAISRRPLTTEAQGRSQVSVHEICGRHSGTGTDFSPSTSVFPCQYHSTSAPYSF